MCQVKSISNYKYIHLLLSQFHLNNIQYLYLYFPSKKTINSPYRNPSPVPKNLLPHQNITISDIFLQHLYQHLLNFNRESLIQSGAPSNIPTGTSSPNGYSIIVSASKLYTVTILLSGSATQYSLTIGILLLICQFIFLSFQALILLKPSCVSILSAFEKSYLVSFSEIMIFLHSHITNF